MKSAIDTKDSYFPASNRQSYMLSTFRNYKLSDNSATYTLSFLPKCKLTCHNCLVFNAVTTQKLHTVKMQKCELHLLHQVVLLKYLTEVYRHLHAILRGPPGLCGEFEHTWSNNAQQMLTHPWDACRRQVKWATQTTLTVVLWQNVCFIFQTQICRFDCKRLLSYHYR